MKGMYSYGPELLGVLTLLAALTLQARADEQKVNNLTLKDGSVKVQGTLAATDAKDEVRKQLCKVYVVNLVKGKAYQIDMMSEEIDSYLRLENAAGKQLAQDDDGGELLNARIIFNCPEDGAYRIVATTFVGGTGPFTLLVKEK